MLVFVVPKPRRFAVMGGLALLLLCASAHAVADEGFTIPPAPNHYVTDNASAMSPGARAKVENSLRGYERDTGHQVIVYIDQTTGDIPLETYTIETSHRWRIGRRLTHSGFPST